VLDTIYDEEEQTKPNTRDPASRVLIGGLVLAAAGLVIEVVSGVPGFPTVPPGPIILAVAALFVALAPWRWAPIVGLLAAVFITVGNAVSDSGALPRLGDPGAFGPFAGTALFLAPARPRRRGRSHRPIRIVSLLSAARRASVPVSHRLTGRVVSR